MLVVLLACTMLNAVANPTTVSDNPVRDFLAGDLFEFFKDGCHVFRVTLKESISLR